MNHIVKLGLFFLLSLTLGFFSLQVIGGQTRSGPDPDTALMQIRDYYCALDTVGISGCDSDRRDSFRLSKVSDSLYQAVVDSTFSMALFLMVTDSALLAEFRSHNDRWALVPSAELRMLRQLVEGSNERHKTYLVEFKSEGFDNDQAAMLARVKSDLNDLAAAEELHYAKHLSYTSNTTDLQWYGTAGVEVLVNYAGDMGWHASATHTKVSDTVCNLWYGQVADTLRWSTEGYVECKRVH